MSDSSPFRYLPSTSARNGNGVAFVRGRVTEIKLATNKVPLFLFKVAPLTGNVSTGDTDNVLDNVAMLQSGFGSLDPNSEPPSGIVYLPKVGSIVLMVWDGSRWVILGFYSGPTRTTLESSVDVERRAVSYNPGIEYAQARAVSSPGWDVPNWAFAMEPGDALLGSGRARLKVNGRGAIMGADTYSCSIHSNDGSFIQRGGTRNSRFVGFWDVIRFQRGMDLESMQAVSANPQQAEALTSATVVRHTVYDVGATPAQLLPYLIQQRGHISREVLNDGRSCTGTEPMRLTRETELQTGKYGVIRDVIAQPTELDGKTPGSELDEKAYSLYDYQVDADGSVRLRAGNRSKVAGHQGPDKTKVADFSFEFDAAMQKFRLRVGQSGAETTLLEIDGTGKVLLACKQAEVVSKGPVTVEASKVTVKSNKIVLDGNVDISGTLTVGKTISAKGEVTALAQVPPGVSLSKHIHPGVQGGGGSTQKGIG